MFHRLCQITAGPCYPHDLSWCRPREFTIEIDRSSIPSCNFLHISLFATVGGAQVTATTDAGSKKYTCQIPSVSISTLTVPISGMSKARVYLQAFSGYAVQISTVFGSTLEGIDGNFGDRFNLIPLTELQWAGNFAFYDPTPYAENVKVEIHFDLSNLKRLYLGAPPPSDVGNAFPQVPSLEQIVCPVYFRTDSGNFLSRLYEGATMYAPPAVLSRYPGKPEGFPGKTVGYEYPGVL